MTTLATSDVHTALARAADQLLSAGGPDGVVSRKDIRAKLRGRQPRRAEVLRHLDLK